MTNRSITDDRTRASLQKALPALLVVYLLGNIMLEAFNLVYQSIGNSLGFHAGAALLSTIPSVVLAILSLLYDALCDFTSPRRMVVIGLCCLGVGSLLGVFGYQSFWCILMARLLQVVGAQAAGSVYLVLSVKYLSARGKAVAIGLFGAVYSAACVFGMVAGGLITRLPWHYLFAIPLCALVCFPFVMRLPHDKGRLHEVDYWGMFVFAGMTGCITIFFDYPNWWWVIAIIVCAVLFFWHIRQADHPFFSRDFIHNRSYMGVVLIIMVFNFFSYATIPIYRVIGEKVYGLSLLTISFYLAVVYALTAVMGALSGRLVNRFGRWMVIMWSAAAMVVGFVLSALCVHTSFVLLTVWACLYNFGSIAAYSPLYDVATSTLPVSERGRGLGLCELTLNTTSAIGMAAYSALMLVPALGEHGMVYGGLLPRQAQAAAFLTSNVFLIMAAVSVAAFVLMVILYRHIHDVTVRENSMESDLFCQLLSGL
ncbi:MAG: MFS transporter [Aeriscardovia sp.]|nr:MFS transporter [Aeriscardovia sp.]